MRTLQISGACPARFLGCLLFLAVFLTGCSPAGTGTAMADTENAPASAGTAWTGESSQLMPVVPAEWQNLRQALARDGLAGKEVDALLATLGPRLEAPMGRKMTELYKSRFLKPKDSGKKPAGDPNAVYKGVVTEKNAALCRQFLKEHSKAFALARQTYGVPSSIAVALLFVETRLGTVLKDVPQNALYTLASMSQSTTLDSIPSWQAKMPGFEKHEDWFAATMPKRAAWAYNETKALVRYMVENGISAESLPGSYYGAIGLCQFMPSNISQYAADGNGDGVINLYEAEDAIMSLSKFLSMHGWKANGTREQHHAVLMRYNKSRKYANTILALANLVAKPAAQQKPAQSGK